MPNAAFNTSMGANTAERLGLAQLYSSRIAPTADWSDISGTGHFVQFYKESSYIVNSIAEYVIHGLRSGDVCIIVASGEHLNEIESIIEGFATDLETVRSEGRYFRLDAKQTLSAIIAGDDPDAVAFASVIGSLVAKAASPGRNVRIYGEMVGLLCAERNYAAAVKLEEMWNELKKDHPFSLFCGYPIHALADHEATAYMPHICDAHTNVIPDESYTSLTNPNDRLKKIVMLQQRVYQLEAEAAEPRHRNVVST